MRVVGADVPGPVTPLKIPRDGIDLDQCRSLIHQAPMLCGGCEQVQITLLPSMGELCVRHHSSVHLSYDKMRTAPGLTSTWRIYLTFLHLPNVRQ